MKTIRFVLILAFLFTFASPVKAQSGEMYGFIPLVTKANPHIPANKYLRLVFWWKIFNFDDGMTNDWFRTNADGSYTSVKETYQSTQETHSYFLTYKAPGSGNVTVRYDPYRP